MAQSGYTPILIYASGTATNVPLAANLTSSASGAELALNYADGKLYYKNSSGVVTLLASATTVTNSFSAGTTGFTPNTATTGAVTLAGTLITSNGGTGLASYTAGDLSYYASGTALTKLAIGTAGQILTSSGTAPQWSTLSGVAVTTFSAGTTGFTPSSATSGAITLAGTLATTNGGTGLTSFTSGGVVYASSSSALATGSALTFNGANILTLFRTTATEANEPTIRFSNLTFAGQNPGVVKSSNGGLALDIQSPSDSTYQLRSRIYMEGGSSNKISFQESSNNGSTYGDRMVLTSTGLGIGTSSPAYKLQVAGTTAEVAEFTSSATATAVRINNTNAAGWGGNLAFYSNGTGAGFVGTVGSLFGNTTQDIAVYATAGNGVRFYTNGSNERMRILSGGDLLVGTASALGSTARVEILAATGSPALFSRAAGDITNQQGQALVLSDATNGNLRANFIVQQIGSRGGLGIGSTEVGVTNDRDIYLNYTGGITAVGGGTTVNTSGGALQLTNGSRGGITFPATQVQSSNVNTLDDYEEGSWTPIFQSDGGTTGTTNVTVRWGRYVKIGMQVTLSFGWTGTLSGFTGVLLIGGTPFAAIEYDTYQFGGSMEQSSTSASGSDGSNFMFFAYSTALYPRFTTGQQIGYLYANGSQINGLTSFKGSITYFTAA